MAYVKMFYIQDTRTTVGNSVMWWAHHGKGYTCDIRKAGVFTEEQAKGICKRETDRMWPIEFINRLIQFHIDFQDLREEKTMPHTIEHWPFEFDLPESAR